MFPLALVQHRLNILRRIRYVLDADDSPHQNVRVAVASAGRHYSRAVDHVDAPRERDVLPDLGFAWNGCGLGDGLAAERVDDAGFARVRIADEAGRDLLTVGVESAELAE